MRVILLLLALIAPASAATLTTEFGSFTTLAASSGAVAGVDKMCVCDGRRAVVFLFDNTGTSFTGNLEQSIDNGTNWTDVSGSATSTDLALIGINNPVGCYRPELSATNTASVVVKWRCAAE